MLPPGHIAAGYLLTKGLLQVWKPSLSPHQLQLLVFWGSFFAFAPDLDMFLTFFHEKKFITSNPNDSHREYFTHAPILWLLAGLAVYFLSPDPFYKYLGLLIWLGSWSHFAIDTVFVGIMWLWPFSNKVLCVGIKEDIGAENEQRKFIPFWLNFLKLYATKATYMFLLEVGLVISAIVVFFR